MTEKFDNILAEALNITNGDRQKYYGHPADNHGNTADLWSAYLGRKYGFFPALKLTSRDVCMMMVLLKVSRDANSSKRDNLVDIAGYVRNADQIEQRMPITEEARADHKWRSEAEAAIIQRRRKNRPWSPEDLQSAVDFENCPHRTALQVDAPKTMARAQPDDFNDGREWGIDGPPETWHGVPIDGCTGEYVAQKGRREFRDRPLSGGSVGPTGPLGPPSTLPLPPRDRRSTDRLVKLERRDRGPAAGPFSGPGRATEAPPTPG